MVKEDRKKNRTNLYAVNHNSFKKNTTLVLEENFDSSNFYGGNGFSIIPVENIGQHLNKGSYIYEVDLPEESVNITHSTPDDPDYKIRSNKIVIKKRYQICFYNTINKLKIKVNEKFVKRYLLTTATDTNYDSKLNTY